MAQKTNTIIAKENKSACSHQSHHIKAKREQTNDIPWQGWEEYPIISIIAVLQFRFFSYVFVWRSDAASRIKDFQVHVLQRHGIIDKYMQNRKIAPYMS